MGEVVIIWLFIGMQVMLALYFVSVMILAKHGSKTHGQEIDNLIGQLQYYMQVIDSSSVTVKVLVLVITDLAWPFFVPALYGGVRAYWALAR